MNIKFRRVRAQQLLKNCKQKRAELTKYVDTILNEDWTELDSAAYEDKMQRVVFYKGQIVTFDEVIAEIESWCY